MNYKDEIEKCINKLRVTNIDSVHYLKQFFGDKEVCVFGTGHIGRVTVRLFKDIGVNVCCFCDNNATKCGTYIDGLYCISPAELLKNKEKFYVVIAMNRYKEVLVQLKNMCNKWAIVDINSSKYKDNFFKNANEAQFEEYKENLLTVCGFLEDDLSKKIFVTMLKSYCTESPFHLMYEDTYSGDEQYYPKDIIRLGDKEVFVDCGSSIGDSIEIFVEKTNYKFHKIYGFELGKERFRQLRINMSRLLTKDFNEKIILYNMGVWDSKEILSFVENKEGSSSLYNNFVSGVDDTQDVDTLDNLIGNQKITYIKMDIEGAELRALHGAENILKIQKPKLAISVYHKLEDMWEIPIYIKKVIPNHKIYFRHHTWLDQDIVCYAVK